MNLEDLVCGNLAQNLKRAARPTNFDAVDLRDFARAKMNGLRTGRRIADARCHMIGLIAQADLGANRVTIAASTNQFQNDGRLD